MKLRLIIIFLMSSFFCQAQDFYLLAGTYTDNGSKGIYVYKFNASTGKALLVNNTDSVVNPSYVIFSNNEKFIYAVNETNKAVPGSVSAFSFNRKSGALTLLNTVFTGGDDPCYLAITPDDKWLTVANYSGGNVSVFPLNKNGSLQNYSQLVQDSGSSVNKERQENAHVHETVFSPDYKYLFTPDLGLDKIMVYTFNSSSNQPLSPSPASPVNVTPGSGPRHLAFHPNKKYAYLINELGGDVIAYRYSKGNLIKMQTIITHKKAFKGVIGSAEIMISPDGKFLYASNRGDENMLTVFSINPTTGKLVVKGYQSTLGIAPRNFIIDPTGNYLLAANQLSDTIIIFRRNIATGLLKDTGERIKISRPVCLQMVKIKAD